METVFLVIIILIIIFNVWKKTETTIQEDRAAKQRYRENIQVIQDNEHLLLDNYRFYKNLPEFSQKKFVTRLHQFMDSRSFIGREIEVDTPMKMVISAAAVKLSFGVNDFQLTGFSKILVYPEEYYNRLTRQYHKGEANGLGVLAFSWKHFKEGLDSPNDNLNLGIHEFAHAYFLQQTKMNGESPFDDYSFNKLTKHIERHDVLKDMQNRSFFRDYAFTNEMEFFAIMAEHFFETPADFKREAPQLYMLFSQVMKQDTTRLGL